MRDKLGLKVLAVLVALAMVVSCTAVLYSGTEGGEGGSESGGGRGVISLMPPPFIGIAGAAETAGGAGAAGSPTVSLSNEAGISAYLNAGSINLNQARTAYKSIDTETPEYIIGIVQISGVDESIYPRVYTNKNGWILAYLPKNEPASAIVQWEGYTGGAITRTTLEDGISKVCNAAGKNYTRDSVSYYDFRFSEANRMLWVVEMVPPSYNSFNFTIQDELTVYNGSWSHYSTSSYGYALTSELLIDEEVISKVVKGKAYGFYNTTTHLKEGIKHTVKLDDYGSHMQSRAATIITYTVPT